MTPLIKNIEPEAFMVFVFTNVPNNIKQLTLRQVRRIKDRFQHHVWQAQKVSVEIDWTRPNVMAAIEQFGFLFDLVHDNIVWHAANNHVEREIFGIDFSIAQNEEINSLLKKAIAEIFTEDGA